MNTNSYVSNGHRFSSGYVSDALDYEEEDFTCFGILHVHVMLTVLH